MKNTFTLFVYLIISASLFGQDNHAKLTKEEWLKDTTIKDLGGISGEISIYQFTYDDKVIAKTIQLKSDEKWYVGVNNLFSGPYSKAEVLKWAWQLEKHPEYTPLGLRYPSTYNSKSSSANTSQSANINQSEVAAKSSTVVWSYTKDGASVKQCDCKDYPENLWVQFSIPEKAYEFDRIIIELEKESYYTYKGKIDAVKNYGSGIPPPSWTYSKSQFQNLIQQEGYFYWDIFDHKNNYDVHKIILWGKREICPEKKIGQSQPDSTHMYFNLIGQEKIGVDYSGNPRYGNDINFHKSNYFLFKK